MVRWYVLRQRMELLELNRHWVWRVARASFQLRTARIPPDPWRERWSMRSYCWVQWPELIRGTASQERAVEKRSPITHNFSILEACRARGWELCASFSVSTTWSMMR